MGTKPTLKVLRFLANLADQVDIECRRVLLKSFECDLQARFLDLGCADGELTMMIAEKIGTKAICGVDAVNENIDRAKTKGIDARQANLNERLPFPDESFDVVCASHCIEHLSDTDTFIKETFRMLTGGGI